MGNWTKYKKKRKEIVVYNNNYMEALYQTDYLAKKIMIAASLSCQEENWKPEGCEVVLSSGELKEMTGILRGSLQHLEKAVKKLTETSVTVKNPNKPKDFIVFNYLPKGEYKDGILTLLINTEMRPFIENLQKNFTQYHIENIKPLKSGYSIRIFELLKMSAYKGIYRIKVDELRKMFGLEKQYQQYSDLRKRVLEPAKKELREHCEIWFEYKEIKKGRKVAEIEFIIHKQKTSFSDYELIEAINQAEFTEKPAEAPETKSSVELELNALGWNGDFSKLTEKVSAHAIDIYLSPLKSQLKSIASMNLDKELIHEFIEKQILSNAREHEALMRRAVYVSLHPKEFEAENRLLDRLLEIGFVGAEKFIKEEGSELIEKALNILEQGYKDKKTTPGAGLLREKVKLLKAQQLNMQIQEEEQREQAAINKKQKEEKVNTNKKELNDIYKLRLENGHGVSIEDHFLNDWSEFLKYIESLMAYTSTGEKEIDIIKQYSPKTLEDLPAIYQEYFLDWRLEKFI